MRRHCTLLALVSFALSACAASRRAEPAFPDSKAAIETIGASTEGRPVRARSLGTAAAPRIAVIAGIHGDETEGLRHHDDLVRWLAPVRARIRLIEDVNPDGTAHGTRETVNGVDPNRNWPAKNFAPAASRGPEPLSEPSVRAVHDDLVRFDPELVIVLHSTRRGPFVNYDGPARELAEVFATAAGAPWHVVADMGYPTPGSFGSWMGIDRGVPTLTVELRRGETADVSGPALERGFAATLAAYLSPPDAARVR